MVTHSVQSSTTVSSMTVQNLHVCSSYIQVYSQWNSIMLASSSSFFFQLSSFLSLLISWASHSFLCSSKGFTYSINMYMSVFSEATFSFHSLNSAVRKTILLQCLRMNTLIYQSFLYLNKPLRVTGEIEGVKLPST